LKYEELKDLIDKSELKGHEILIFMTITKKYRKLKTNEKSRA